MLFSVLHQLVHFLTQASTQYPCNYPCPSNFWTLMSLWVDQSSSLALDSSNPLSLRRNPSDYYISQAFEFMTSLMLKVLSNSWNLFSLGFYLFLSFSQWQALLTLQHEWTIRVYCFQNTFFSLLQVYSSILQTLLPSQQRTSQLLNHPVAIIHWSQDVYRYWILLILALHKSPIIPANFC